MFFSIQYPKSSNVVTLATVKSVNHLKTKNSSFHLHTFLWKEHFSLSLFHFELNVYQNILLPQFFPDPFLMCDFEFHEFSFSTKPDSQNPNFVDYKLWKQNLIKSNLVENEITWLNPIPRGLIHRKYGNSRNSTLVPPVFFLFSEFSLVLQLTFWSVKTLVIFPSEQSRVLPNNGTDLAVLREDNWSRVGIVELKWHQ